MNWKVTKKQYRKAQRAHFRGVEVVKLIDLDSERGSWCRVRGHGAWSASEIDAAWLMEWARRCNLARVARRYLAGDTDALALGVAYDFGCGLYVSNDDGERLAWVADGCADDVDD